MEVVNCAADHVSNFSLIVTKLRDKCTTPLLTTDQDLLICIIVYQL